jgi:hypothetical protein
MSRYIDADDVANAIYHHFPSVRTMADARGVIEEAPSIDIVRCKECKYKRIYDGETKYYYCALEDRPNRQWSIDEMDYCSWGERKESDE